MFTLISVDGNQYHSMTATKRLIPDVTVVIVTAAHRPGSHNFVPAFIKKAHSERTWKDLLLEKYPYHVGHGMSSVATCRSCAKKFSKDELRIRFEINRKVGRSIMPPCMVNVCMKFACVQNAFKRRSQANQPLVRVNIVLILQASTIHRRRVCSKGT